MIFIPKKKNKALAQFAILLVFVFVFIITFRNNVAFLDVDLGWHLKVGRDLIAKGIWPQADIYSFTHPGHPWVDHEWLADVLTYLVYIKFGWVSLCTLTSAIILLCFYLQLKIIAVISKVKPILISLVFILAITTLLDFVGVRMQILSWLGISTLMLILIKHHYENKAKLLFWLPLLFLLWANLHGGFIAGLGILAIYTIFSKHNKKQLYLVTFLSFVATLINPYLGEIYQEVWRVATDSFGKSYIVEWRSFFSYPLNLFYLVYVALFIGLLIPKRSRQLIPTVFMVITGLVFITALLHKRNMAIFVLVSLPWIYLIINDFCTRKNINQYLQPNYIFFSGLGFALLISSLLLLEKTNCIMLDPYENPQIYPYQTVTYLKENDLTGNTYANFSWGGYLLWNMPENYQVFYDGRMVHWKTETDQFLKEYIELSSAGNDWETVVQKYNIQYIIVDKRTHLARLEATDWLNQLFFESTIKKINDSKSSLYTTLTDSNNWTIIHENDESYIFSQTK